LTPPTPPAAGKKLGVRTIAIIVGATACGCLLALVAVGVIAAIAIPNLQRAKVSSTGSAAVAALRTYAGAQNIYHETDWDSDGVLEYCGPSNKEAPSFTCLATTVADGRPIELIDAALAQATGPNAPWRGYYFVDIARGADGRPYDAASECGLCAVPAQYNRTGRKTFIVDATGTIYEKDTGSDAPVFQWPDVNAPDSGWTQCD
jgi:type II secretory pathway pseudopilin PulG